MVIAPTGLISRGADTSTSVVDGGEAVTVKARVALGVDVGAETRVATGVRVGVNVRMSVGVGVGVGAGVGDASSVGVF